MATPSWAAFVGAGEGVVLDGNRVIGNGPLSGATNVKLFGFRGGLLIRTTVLTAEAFAGADQTLVSGMPAGVIHDNIVDTGIGRAPAGVAWAGIYRR